jgi:cytochrome c peroxidase
MKYSTILFFLITAVSVILFSGAALKSKDIGAENATVLFGKDAAALSLSLADLCKAVDLLDADPLTLQKAKASLRSCRVRYKRIAFFTSYFFPSETAMYNAAPKYEVEEPELELVEPMGLQQIEALLFEDNLLAHKNELQLQTRALYSSVKDLKNLLYQFKADDRQVLESIRLELIRMVTLYISGYDAPSLKTGIRETMVASIAIRTVLQPYLVRNQSTGKILAEKLNSTINYLGAHQDFDSFNRMEYIVRYANPLQKELGLFIERAGLEHNTSVYLNYNVANLFSKGFLKNWDSVPEIKRAALAVKGKKLFFDTSLSGNLKVSCASCHQPEHYFTDGKVRSPSLIADAILKRNTPTLLYAGFQHSQFWDGRARNLVEQVKTVVFNPMEMGGKRAVLDKRIDSSAMAIAAYLASLNPLNSAFDRYLQGNRNAMSKDQVKGFNLFMGKAQCGTCHFAPYFNSLVPPFYDISEIEILGTTKDDEFSKPAYDTDMGRFDLYKIRYYQRAFKTPTVRNAQMTAPYMHNGKFRSLESVLDFYNKGGGNGLGLNIEDQTLPSKPLNLTKKECNQIIQFINSLTDNNNTFIYH